MLSSTLLWTLWACQPQTSSTDAPETEAVATRGGGIGVRAPTWEGRAEAAWAAAPGVTISDAGAKFVAKVGTPVATDAPDELSGLAKDTKVVDIAKDDAVKKALFGTDDKAAADAIRATGAKVLVVHTDLRPSFDRDSHVLSRLYHHDALDYFQLARVENGAFVYLVVDAPLNFPPDVAAASIKWLREKLAGHEPGPFPPLKPERSNWKMVASLRGQGQELAFSLAEAPTLDKALNEIAFDLEVMHRRQREPMGFPALKDQMADLTIELHRVTECADVVPRDEGTLEDLWEMGVDGAILLDRVGDKKQSGVWPGSVASTRGITKADAFLRGIAKDFRWDSNRPWRDSSEVELQVIRTTHYMELANGGVVQLFRGEPAVPMSSVNLTTVRDSIVLAGEWYLANLHPDGMVTYKMWPEENRYSNEYNHVRHTLATWNLWEAWTLDPRPEFLEGALRAQEWTLKAVGEKDGMAYMTYGGRTKLGSVVVALLGMIETAKATNDHSHDELMRKLGKFVKYMQKPEGNFYAYWDAKTGTYQEYDVGPNGEHVPLVNDIVPGEAALSLVYLSEYFHDDSYLETLPKFFDYYKPWFKERAVRRHDDGAWPRFTYDNDDRLELVQFGPWTVMAASAYTRVRPEAKDVAAFGLEVGRWMIDTYEYTMDRTPWPDYVGGYYKFEGELPAMQAFCYGEGTAAAYDMALRMSTPEEAAYFEEHTRETVRFAMQVQHDGLDTRPYSRPLEIMGGIKYAMNEPKVRIDYVHHALSAMYQWLQAAKKDANLPAEVKAAPDEKLVALMKLEDMPSVRPANLPKWRTGDPPAKPGTVVRTSVPAAAAGAGDEGVQADNEKDEGGE